MELKDFFKSSIIIFPIALTACGGGNSSNEKINQSPIANIQTSSSEFYNNLDIQLDGSKSNDPDGDSLTYIWAVTEQPKGSQISFSQSHSATPKFTANLPGHYVLSLTVNDGKVESTPATLSLDILDEETRLNCEVVSPGNLEIATKANSNIQKDDYIDAVLTLKDADFNVLSTLNTEIKGRGNSTWGAPKKPYRLKVKKSSVTTVYDMPENRNWALLANAYDGTMLRNSTALCLGKNFIRNSWTPNYRFTNVNLNGVDQGLYLLTEHVEIKSNKINLGNNDTEDNPDIHEFFVEMTPSSRLNDKDIFVHTNRGTYYEVKSDVSDDTTTRNQQLNYITNYLNQVEDSIYLHNFDENNGYSKYIDVDSAIDYILLNELFKDNDRFWASTHLFKKTDGKLTFGPIWDYDLSAGDYVCNGNANPEGWWVLTRNYPSQLMQDPKFKSKLISRWIILKKKMPNLIKQIDKEAVNIQNAQVNNYKLWTFNTQSMSCDGAPINLGSTYNEQVSYLKSWLTKRAEWMDNELSK